MDKIIDLYKYIYNLKNKHIKMIKEVYNLYNLLIWNILDITINLNLN